MKPLLLTILILTTGSAFARGGHSTLPGAKIDVVRSDAAVKHAESIRKTRRQEERNEKRLEKLFAAH